MSAKRLNFGFFSAFTLKVLACLFMLVDHVGFAFFPEQEWMRIVGRIAYPLFAFFIAEGCRYTKNKHRRFLSVFVLGVICELVFVVFYNKYFGNILLTFSISILLIYLLQYAKKSFGTSEKKGVVISSVFCICVAVTFLFCEYIGIEYGFFGIMTPVLVTLFDDVSCSAKENYQKPVKRFLSIAMFALGLLLLALYNPSLGDLQMWGMLAIPLVVMYNGNKGKYSFKYGFYLFYPLHLVLIQALLYAMNIQAI